MKKEVKALIRDAVRAGATYEGLNGGGHHVLRWEGKRITLPSTPSDRRAMLNAKSWLRRNGVPLPR